MLQYAPVATFIGKFIFRWRLYHNLENILYLYPLGVVECGEGVMYLTCTCISLADNRASCSTTVFTAALLALVTEVLGLPGRVSSSTENFPALKALTHLKLCALKWSEVHIYHTIHKISALNLY